MSFPNTTMHWGHNTSIVGDNNYSTINNFGGSQITFNRVDPLQVLGQAIADVGGTHNSELRYPPPKCHPETRREVQQLLAEEIDSHAGSRIYWLSGSAGVGKSAVAQSVSENCEQNRKLVASFFFYRNHPKRNVPTYLFLTIAYGLASTVPELRDSIGSAIQSNPMLLHSSLELQFTELIAKPCRSLGGQGQEWGERPRLVVIDGLDECNGSEPQTRVLSIIADAIRDKAGLALQFLICSRPEPTIREFFDSNIFSPNLWCYSLHDDASAWHDIKAFLCTGFQTIRLKPRYQHIPFPAPWPSNNVINILAEKSSGQFIYPSTILKYVDDEYSNPCQRLDVVCGLALNADSTSPFQELDLLYTHILSTHFSISYNHWNIA
ncbi:hypothetical protein L218DRAFT_981439 [Marasmius fiardii PR-910]|nr:hypothetical protein L218DRAFT_981439 [Marasmius fiardii PR-910]